MIAQQLREATSESRFGGLTGGVGRIGPATGLGSQLTLSDIETLEPKEVQFTHEGGRWALGPPVNLANLIRRWRSCSSEQRDEFAGLTGAGSDLAQEVSRLWFSTDPLAQRRQGRAALTSR